MQLHRSGSVSIPSDGKSSGVTVGHIGTATVKDMTRVGGNEKIFLKMALESVHVEHCKAAEELGEEPMLTEQYRQPHVVMYQAFPERVFTKRMHPTKPVCNKTTVDASAGATRPSGALSIESTGSQHSKP
jgi:hypothetical protein